MYKIGFIGSGKMASAIIKGLIKTGFAKPEELIATQAETEGVEEKSKELQNAIQTNPVPQVSSGFTSYWLLAIITIVVSSIVAIIAFVYK